MSSFFTAIYNWIEKHRIISIVLLLLVVGISAYFTTKLRFSEDITKILPDNEKISNMNFVYSNSKFLDKVVFNIGFNDSSTVDPQLLSTFANKLTDSINARYIPNLVQSIEQAPGQDNMMDVYQIVHDYLPIFLTPDDYNKIDTIIQPGNISKSISSDYATLISPTSFVTKRFIAADPLHLTPIALNKFKSLNTDNDFQVYNDYFISGDKKNIVFLIIPLSTNNTSGNNKLFEGIDRIIDEITTEEFSDIRVDYFGNAVVALGNANQIKSDIIITISIALLLLIVAISIFFRSKRSFFIIFLPVAFGALVSLAILFIVKKEISAISLGIGAVLLGICVDFALHIYTHFREHGSQRLILKNLSTPIILSSLTTASAFPFIILYKFRSPK